MSDGRLIARMKQGDAAAFDTFIRRHYDDIVAYCQRHTDTDEATAIAQDVFLLFFKHLGDYQHRGKAKNYLYTIARNCCINHGRLRHHRDLSVEQLGATPAEQGYDPMGRSVETIALQAYVDQLDRDYQEVIRLRYWEDMKVDDVAEALDISTPLVNHRLRQAKARLKTLITREERDEPHASS